MAERIDRMPLRFGVKYPWDEWFDGSAWELIRGKDFECATGTMYANVKSAARGRRVEVTVVVRGDRLYVQAQRPE